MLSKGKQHRITIFTSILITLIIGVAGFRTVLGQSDSVNKVIIYLFWGDGCPHCAAEKPFLEDLASNNPNIEIRDFEIYNIEANRPKFEQMAKAFGFEPTGVPTTFIGTQYWVGFSDATKEQIQAAVNYCLENTCPDAGAGILDSPNTNDVPVEKTPIPFELDPTSNVINFPLLGKIDLSTQSLAISTLLIAFVDGVNPCSIWVLSMLMALVIHTGSRKKVLIIGFVFLTVTAAIYAMFIAGLFSVLKIISFVGWIQVLVALVAFIFAVVNIKDYFWYKEGVSFTISDQNKTGIIRRMRNVLSSTDNIWSLIGATIVLAAGVSLVEFSCTAGFPVLWTNLLNSQNVAYGTFLALLLLYMVIYQLDEMAIFATVVVTLKASKLEEKQGRILKLIGGSLMLTLSIVMLIDPKIMNDLGSSLAIFGIAFGFALFVLLMHRVILPKFGIHIGTEMAKRKTKKKSFRN